MAGCDSTRRPVQFMSGAARRTTRKRNLRDPAPPAYIRKAAPALSPQTWADLGALGIILLAGLLAGGYYLPGSTGAAGGWIVAFSRLFIGVLTAAAPLLLAAVAAFLAFDSRRALNRQMGIGAGLLLLALLGLAHELTTPCSYPYDSTAARLRALAGMPHDTLLAARGDGGVVGAVLAALLMPLGNAGALMALGSMLTASILLMGDLTLRAVAEAMHQKAGSTARRAREHVGSIQKQAGSALARLPERAAPAARMERGDPREGARPSQPKQENRALARLREPEIQAPAEPPLMEPSGQLLLPGTGEPRAARRSRRQPSAPPGEYQLPPLELLEPRAQISRKAHDDTEANITILENTLGQFRIEAQVVEVSNGPSVTRYEIRLGEGIRVKKILDLADNIAMSLAAYSVRVEAPIPGKAAIGIEVPKKHPDIVTLRECLDSNEYRDIHSPVGFVLGKDVGGEVRCADLARMPHLLVAGATNSGKSVCLNVLIASMLYRARPDDLKMILIDPKRVELTLFDGIPHLIHPVVKDVKQAAGILRWVLKEMDRRYELFARVMTRNIDNFNAKMESEPDKRLPFIVVVIDELADLMMQQGPEVEQSICRLAQLARATGIHLVVATQRPSVDVITGLIKANVPSRIAFAVTSQIDSRTILDGKGAESLVGRGDMLFKPVDANKPTRIQGAFLRESEVEALVKYLRTQGKPEFLAEALTVDSGAYGRASQEDAEDDLFEPAARFIIGTGHASTSMIQRRFKIGYTRAARLVDMMEARGILGPLDGAKPRDILMSAAALDEMFRGVRASRGGQSDPEDPEDPEEDSETLDAGDIEDRSGGEDDSPWVDDERDAA